MRPTTIRKLHALHRWVGVFISLNLLILSVTGILLVFHEEIDALLGDVPHTADSTAESLPVSKLIEAAQKLDPDRAPVSINWDEEHPGVAFVYMENPANRDDSSFLSLDTATGEPSGAGDVMKSFSGLVLDLHVNLFMGLKGQIYVGLVGVAFLVMLITGFILYGPFMKKLAFGFLRRGRAAFTSADLHKSLGAATFAWNLVVAFTGVLLAFGSFLLQIYQVTELARLKEITAKNRAPSTETISIDEAAARARDALPEMQLASLILPGSEVAGEHHFLALKNGAEGLEERLFSLVLIDRESGEVLSTELPWYLKAIFLSQPLHFGDYGGLPLKLLWAAFSLVTITLIVSGFYVWARRRLRRRREEKEVSTDLPTGVVEVAE